MLRYSANEVALCANDVLLRKNCGREHPHPRRNKLHNRKNLRANPLMLLRLFLLSPKSLLCNTFRGPHFVRFALLVIDESKLDVQFDLFSAPLDEG